MAVNYYQILGISASASDDEIKAAYRDLAKKYHPDKNSSNGEEFKKISEAYTILFDPLKRREYDLQGQLSLRDPAENRAERYFRRLFGGEEC